ncbi:MAG TPA: hypothetical protein DCS87_01480 [Rheinheimera sp.]|nr:hypothetical protein [Rheinheimera sp.]
MELLKLSVRNLRARLGHTLAAIAAFAGVLFVFAVLQAFSHGLSALWHSAGVEPLILYKEGSQSEALSQLTAADVSTATDLLQNRWPELQWSAETVINADVEQTSGPVSVTQRGLDANKAQPRGASLVQGRWFTPGSDEVVIGQQLLAQLPGIEVGQRLQLGRHRWMVVGVFRHEIPMFDSEIWLDQTSLQSAFNRGNQAQSVYLILPATVQAVDVQALVNDKLSVPVKVQSSGDYFATQMQDFKSFVDSLAWALTGVMLLGLLFGGASVLESTFSNRRAQLLTMHALGFSRRTLAGMLTCEAALLGLFSAIVGVVVAWLLLSGQQIGTLHQQSQLVVTMQVDVVVVLLTALAGAVTAVFSAWLTFQRLSRLQHL